MGRHYIHERVKLVDWTFQHFNFMYYLWIVIATKIRSQGLLHCRWSYPSLCTSFTSALEQNISFWETVSSFHLVAALLLNRQVELELSWKLLFRIQPWAFFFENSKNRDTTRENHRSWGLHTRVWIIFKPVRKVDSPDPAVGMDLNLEFNVC